MNFVKKTIAILCILTIILTIGCAKQPAEEKQEETTPTPPVEEITQTVEPEQTEEVTPSTELLSEVRCTDGKIVGVLTNTASFSIEVEKDIQLHINGLINRELSCTKTALEPGQATFCETLNGRIPIRSPGKNRLTAVLDGSSYDDVITC